MRGPLLLLTVSSLLAGCAGTAALQVPIGRIAGGSSAASSGASTEAASPSSVDDTPVPATSAAPASEASSPEISGSKVIEPIASIPRTTPPPTRSVLLAKLPTKDALTVAAEGMPLRNLLNYVFTEQLKLSFVLVDQGPVLDEPVTLNTQKPVSSQQLYRLIAELLATKGLAVAEKDGVVFVGPASGKTGEDLPISYGRRAEDVPDVPGNIVQVIPIRYAAADSIVSNLRSFTGATIRQELGQGAVIVSGNRASILRVIELVNLFDQPSLRSTRIGLVTLTFLNTKEYIDQITALLENEGIPAAPGRGETRNVVFVPLEQLGGVVIFAFNSDLLSRVEFWTRQIDRAPQGSTQRYFVYQPKYARASDLGASLANLLGQGFSMQPGSPESPGSLARDTRSALGSGEERAREISESTALRRETLPRRSGSETQQGISIRAEGLTMSVDPRSNALVFNTSGPRYESMLPMIRRLDVPPKQIVLEAMIAEVSLNGEFANGVEFAFANSRLRNGKQENLSGGTLGSLGLPGGGLSLNYISDVTDQIRLKLSASDGQVNVLSNPIVVVRDGTPASISVGNDVPTVGATASNPLQSGTQVTSVLYRKTGLELSVTPTINAEGSVVMQIAQQISSTVPGSSGVNGAPIFFTRSISTEVVAGSGQSVLLGGLISESSSSSRSGIPGLSRVPGLGALFRSDSKRREKTELVLLLTPRVISAEGDWAGVTRELVKALKFVDLSRLESSGSASTGVSTKQ